MILVIGLIILIAAIVTGVVGVLGNSGGAHALTHGFSVFGYHVTGSTGALFLTGIVVGAVGLLGLSLLLAGARRTSRRGRTARRDLSQSRHENAVVSKDRDTLIDQRDTARADTERANTARADTARADTADTTDDDSSRPPGPLASANGHRGRPQLFRRGAATAQPSTTER